jgi:hypothetical protein
MDRNHSLIFLGLDKNAIVDEDGARGWSRAGEKRFLTWDWRHGFFASPILSRFEKRTGLGPHPEKRKAKSIAVSRDA